MDYTHTFEANLAWSKTEKASSNTNKVYIKNHLIQIKGKQDLAVSAAKAFKGDPSLYNPEDLLLSSIVSCHMMSYLYVCSQHQIDVISYIDHAIATLQTYTDGSGKIIEVILHPEVVISDPKHIELAISLHEQANKLCFIANSCNFPIKHHANCSGPSEQLP